MAKDKDERQGSLELVPFMDGGVEIRFGFDTLNETVWATQQQIAELFERDSNTIGEHIANIFREGELAREATTRKFRVVRPEGGRPVGRDIDHYNLDAILSVGLAKSCAKLGITFWDYLGDRLAVPHYPGITHLPQLVRHRCQIA
jgi:hypothetical protein